MAGEIIRSLNLYLNTPLGIGFDGRTLWVIDQGTHYIYQVDPVTGTVIRSFNSPGSNPFGVGFDGHFLYVGSQSSGYWYQIDPSTGSWIRRWFPASDRAMAVCVVGKILVCSQQTDQNLGVFDLVTLTLIKTLTCTGARQTNGLAWDGKHLYACNLFSGDIWQINLATDRIVRTISLSSGAACGVAFDGRSLWVADLSGASVYQVSL
jgi:DNA-binding beta-propeller fold protein YncE